MTKPSHTPAAADALPSWAAPYIGVPWREHGRTRDGWDCWGLAVNLYREVFQIDLPSYALRYPSTRDRVAVARLFFEEATTSARWRLVPLAEAQAPDVLSLALAGEQHVGVLVAPERFLHVLSGRQTVVERLRPHWAGRVQAVYRHEAFSG